MAGTIVRTFSLLKETDTKLEEMTRATFRRNKGDVIDWLVGEAFERMMAERNRKVVEGGAVAVLAPLAETAEVAK